MKYIKLLVEKKLLFVYKCLVEQSSWFPKHLTSHEKMGYALSADFGPTVNFPSDFRHFEICLPFNSITPEGLAI